MPPPLPPPLPPYLPLSRADPPGGTGFLIDFRLDDAAAAPAVTIDLAALPMLSFSQFLVVVVFLCSVVSGRRVVVVGFKIERSREGTAEGVLSKIVVVDVVDDGSGVIYLRLDDIGELSSMAKEVAGRVTCGSILLGVSWFVC